MTREILNKIQNNFRNAHNVAFFENVTIIKMVTYNGVNEPEILSGELIPMTSIQKGRFRNGHEVIETATNAVKISFIDHEGLSSEKVIWGEELNNLVSKLTAEKQNAVENETELPSCVGNITRNSFKELRDWFQMLPESNKVEGFQREIYKSELSEKLDWLDYGWQTGLNFFTEFFNKFQYNRTKTIVCKYDGDIYLKFVELATDEDNSEVADELKYM